MSALPTDTSDGFAMESLLISGSQGVSTSLFYLGSAAYYQFDKSFLKGY